MTEERLTVLVLANMTGEKKKKRYPSKTIIVKKTGYSRRRFIVR